MRTMFQTVREETCCFKDAQKLLTMTFLTLHLSIKVVTKRQILTRVIHDFWLYTTQCEVAWMYTWQDTLVEIDFKNKQTITFFSVFLRFLYYFNVYLANMSGSLLVNLAAWYWLQDPRLYRPKPHEYSGYGGEEKARSSTHSLQGPSQRPPRGR